MKLIKYSLVALLAIIFGITASAQTHNPNMNMKMVNTKTEIFKVWGNCGMCKARIEKAVKEEGATSADWNSAKIETDYTCPMHSDVHSDKPGKCPKCSMELVKKEKTKPVPGM